MVLERLDAWSRVKEILGLLAESMTYYERAYDRTRNKQLHHMFGAMASERVLMIAELQAAKKLMRGRLVKGGRKKLKRPLKNWLTSIRNPFWALNDAGILQAGSRNERYILSVYERHLMADQLPVGLSEVLMKHRAIIQSNLRDMELFQRTDLAMA